MEYPPFLEASCSLAGQDTSHSNQGEERSEPTFGGWLVPLPVLSPGEPTLPSPRDGLASIPPSGSDPPWTDPPLALSPLFPC